MAFSARCEIVLHPVGGHKVFRELFLLQAHKKTLLVEFIISLTAHLSSVTPIRRTGKRSHRNTHGDISCFNICIYN